MADSPKRIYLESTNLFQLGPTFENVDFEKLLELRRLAGFEVLVSEISWQEYLRKRKKELADFLNSCARTERLLQKHGKDIPEVAQARAKVQQYLEDIDTHYRAKASRKGIQIVPLASVKMERLLKMSIACTPPFEEMEDESKEKGFRDSLIMFSILESLRGKSNLPAVVVTNDKLLGKGFELYRAEFEANIIVMNGLDNTNAYVTGTIADSERERLKAESAEAIEMLKDYKEDIAGSISEIRELTESELGQTIVAAAIAPQKYIDIRGVKSISFERIDSAIWKDKDKQVSRILFRCVCKAAVLVPAPHLRQILGTQRSFLVGDATPSEAIFYSVGPDPTIEKELPLQFYGTADFKRVGTEWNLTQMRIDKSLPPEEEFRALVAAEIAQVRK